MSKWIAELELEDGDKMPEHMDLEYRGAKLDFHCRPIGKTYEDGLNDAWECAKKVLCDSGCNLVELEDIFGNHTIDGIFNTYTASEAIDAIEKYESERIKVGDEVKYRSVVGVVLEHDDNSTSVMKTNGNVSTIYNKRDLKKTGRHFPQIEELLQKMQEGNE